MPRGKHLFISLKQRLPSSSGYILAFRADVASYLVTRYPVEDIYNSDEAGTELQCCLLTKLLHESSDEDELSPPLCPKAIFC